MKAKAGAVIQLTEKVCYGTIYGLVEVEKGTILHVANRSESDDSIETVETVTLFKTGLGESTVPIAVWDSSYMIVSGDSVEMSPVEIVERKIKELENDLAPTYCGELEYQRWKDIRDGQIQILHDVLYELNKK